MFHLQYKILKQHFMWACSHLHYKILKQHFMWACSTKCVSTIPAEYPSHKEHIPYPTFCLGMNRSIPTDLDKKITVALAWNPVKKIQFSLDFPSSIIETLSRNAQDCWADCVGRSLNLSKRDIWTATYSACFRKMSQTDVFFNAKRHVLECFRIIFGSKLSVTRTDRRRTDRRTTNRRTENLETSLHNRPKGNCTIHSIITPQLTELL